jgi:hypothetical protein
VYDDPVREYIDDANANRASCDPAAEFRRGWRLLDRTASLVLSRLGVVPPSGADSVRQVCMAQEMLKTDPDLISRFDMSRGPMPPGATLVDLYREAFWFKKASRVEPLGQLPEDAPYNDLAHLLRCLLNSAAQLVSASPPPLHRDLEPYWQLEPSGDCGVADPQEEEDDSVLEALWAAAHEPGQAGPWSPPIFYLVHGDLGDVVLSERCEVFLYSDALRAAVESGRQPQDDHVWLPIKVLTAAGSEAQPYWLLNASGRIAADAWGLVPEWVAGRTVVLRQGGDDDPAFAERVRVPIEAACPSVILKPA